MGKIIETNYHETVGKLTSFATDLVNNSFYVLNDKKPSIVTYYNINREKIFKYNRTRTIKQLI